MTKKFLTVTNVSNGFIIGTDDGKIMVVERDQGDLDARIGKAVLEIFQDD